MPEKIQRVPGGLLNVLSISGGRTPQELEDRVTASLELMQLYGLSQLQLPLTVDGALASAGTVDIIVPATQWWVFFQANVSVTEQAALTSLQLQLVLFFAQQSNQIIGWNEKRGAAGTFVAGDEFIVHHVSPYPRVLPPLTRIRARPRFAGVATVACGVTATVGVLG
jgi:hypothetical protein